MKTVIKITLGVLLAGTILIGGCVALVGGAANEAVKEMDREQAQSAITSSEAKAIEMGTSRSDVEAKLGPPRDTQEMETEGFDGDTLQSDCIYYNVKGGEFLEAWQFCFENGRLTSRNRM